MSSAQKYCSDCSIVHKREYGIQYWHSDKGQDIYKRRLELMRKQPKRQPHLCAKCGKQIDRRSTLCLHCSLQHQREIPSEQSPNWKGGRHVDPRGYVFIRYRTRFGKNGYIAEHRLVWEQGHGEPLPKGWIIHHLNGIRSDNRQSNLFAMPRKRHNQLPQVMAKRIQELEGLLRQQSLLL